MPCNAIVHARKPPHIPSSLRCTCALPLSSPSQQLSLLASRLCVLCDTPFEDCTLDSNLRVFMAIGIYSTREPPFYSRCLSLRAPQPSKSLWLSSGIHYVPPSHSCRLICLHEYLVGQSQSFRMIWSPIKLLSSHTPP